MSWKTRNCYSEDVFKTFWRPKNICWNSFIAVLLYSFCVVVSPIVSFCRAVSRCTRVMPVVCRVVTRLVFYTKSCEILNVYKLTILTGKNFSSAQEFVL